MQLVRKEGGDQAICEQELELGNHEIEGRHLPAVVEALQQAVVDTVSPCVDHKTLFPRRCIPENTAHACGPSEIALLRMGGPRRL